MPAKSSKPFSGLTHLNKGYIETSVGRELGNPYPLTDLKNIHILTHQKVKVGIR
jgi:hypothetical protein